MFTEFLVDLPDLSPEGHVGQLGLLSAGRPPRLVVGCDLDLALRRLIVERLQKSTQRSFWRRLARRSEWARAVAATGAEQAVRSSRQCRQCSAGEGGQSGRRRWGASEQCVRRRHDAGQPGQEYYRKVARTHSLGLLLRRLDSGTRIKDRVSARQAHAALGRKGVCGAGSHLRALLRHFPVGGRASKREGVRVFTAADRRARGRLRGAAAPAPESVHLSTAVESAGGRCCSPSRRAPLLKRERVGCLLRLA